MPKRPLGLAGREMSQLQKEKAGAKADRPGVQWVLPLSPGPAGYVYVVRIVGDYVRIVHAWSPRVVRCGIR